jgi:thioredoxin-dependent peroxiredoxin
MKAFVAVCVVVSGMAGSALVQAQGQMAAAQAPAAPTLKVGDMAPDFSLQASDGKTYKLSSFRGKQAVVLAWFPAAFTGGCTVECKSLAENGDKIRKFDVTYFMASTDSLEKQTEFAKATSVTLGTRVVEKKASDFPMLADPTMEAARAYGVVTGDRKTASRWTFYIDKSGKIAAIDTEVSKRTATSAEDMIAKLEELKVTVRK